MILTSPSTATTFEFQVLGYEFPDLAHNDYDSNWLDVRIKVQSPDLRWEAVDPALLTREGHWLVTWLDDILARRECEAELDFVEPCIRLETVERLASSVGIRVTLGYDFRPPKMAYDEPEEIEISLLVSDDNLRNAIADLRRQLRSFPMRAGWVCSANSTAKTGCTVCGS